MDINRLGPRRLACLLVTLVGPAVAAAATPGTFLKLDDDTLREKIDAVREAAGTLHIDE